MVQSSTLAATTSQATPQLTAVRRSANESAHAVNEADNEAEHEADIEAENATAAQADHDLLSQIIQGYTTDPWFAKGSNTAWLDVHGGLYYRGDA